MNKLELEFRKEITKRMAGTWLPSIHVENNLNPGIPDMSYVMVGDDHETGWLELKAVSHEKENSLLKFTLEPSQFRWFESHGERVPSHLLLRGGDDCYLVHNRYRHRFLESISKGELLKCATLAFHISLMRSVLPRQLSTITNRSILWTVRTKM